MAVKQRNVGLCIVLTIVTCGIYGLYWLVVLNDDINTVTNKPGTSGGVVLILTIVTCSIYGIYWAYKMGEKLDQARAEHGAPTGNLAILYLVLNLFGLSIVTWALAQSEVNKYAPAA